jgi:hypothetical protein
MKRASRGAMGVLMGAIGSGSVLLLVGLGDGCGLGASSGLVVGGICGLLADTVLQAAILGLLLGNTFGPVGTYVMILTLIPRGL